MGAFVCLFNLLCLFYLSVVFLSVGYALDFLRLVIKIREEKQSAAAQQNKKPQIFKLEEAVQKRYMVLKIREACRLLFARACVRSA